MNYNVSVDLLVEQLEHIRETLGEEAYRKARYDIAIGLVLKPNGEAFLKKAFPDMDLAAIRAEAADQASKMPESNPENAMLDYMRKQIPNLKTQAQFTLFMTAFDALRTCIDGYFGNDPVRAAGARDALGKALDVAAKLNELAAQVEEIPIESRSATASEYVAPPKQFHEYDDQRRLLLELAGVGTLVELETWYKSSKSTMDRIVSTSLRNELFDKIRVRKVELTQTELN